MKHADVSFDGDSVHVSVDRTVQTPVLRPLDEEAAFDPELPWSVLSDKAYNFQFGWNPGGFISLPAGAWIWVEEVDASSGLEVYQRPPATPSYEPIFEENGSIWKWPGAMTHNVYAVETPKQDAFQATYRVYIGEETTGEELIDADGMPLYDGDLVTFQFDLELMGDYDDSGFLDPADVDIMNAEIMTGTYDSAFDLDGDEVLTDLDRMYWVRELADTTLGDADLNGQVEFADFLRLSAAFGTDAGWGDGDFSGNGQIDFADFLALSSNFQSADSAIPASVPEPSGFGIGWILIMAAIIRHRGLPHRRANPFSGAAI